MRRRDDIDRGHRKGGLVRAGIRGLSGVVGLASESVKANKSGKESKGATESVTELPPAYAQIDPNEGNKAPEDTESREARQASEESEQQLENEWDLDDAQDEIAGAPSDQPATDIKNAVDKFLYQHPIDNNVVGKLGLPVVLPQRRPKDRNRGFIRAYAPALQNCDIDQETWLSFLDVLQKSSAADPWINAINFAAIGTMFMPHAVGWAVGLAIQEAAKATMELQSRYRTSKLIQKFNEEFFQPRGLYCLVMTWNPESRKRVEEVDINGTIASRVNISGESGGSGNAFRSSDGKTYGGVAFPEVAPLVFPTLDELAAATGVDANAKKGQVAKKMGFVLNYWDKRATADYALQNPDSVLAQVPQQEFNSRYADPNHPAASGSMISFLSGGRLIPGPNSRGLIGGLVSVTGQAWRGEKQGSEWEKYDAQYKDSEKQRRYQAEGRKGVLSMPLKYYKKLFNNVLYLMVVPMPSEEEILAAKATYE